MIPPLLLQTFIENSVKYAMNMDTVVELRLNGARLESDPDKMVFTIEDTGPGFPPNILEALENGKRIVDERGEHIGIFNVQQRLWLVYGDQSEISFENTDGPGARIRIVLPIQTTAYSEVVPDESADR